MDNDRIPLSAELAVEVEEQRDLQVKSYDTHSSTVDGDKLLFKESEGPRGAEEECTEVERASVETGSTE